MPKTSEKAAKSEKARKTTDRDDGIVGDAKPAPDAKTQPLPPPDLAKPSAEALPIEDPSETVTDADTTHGPRLRALFDIAQEYGNRSFDNYARIRSVAETIRDEFCAWLAEDGPCVFLVPPEGRFSAKNYQSAAFSVAGKGYLPLKPISFGLAVRVSSDKDYMRIKITCRKEGDAVFVRLERGKETRLPIPEEDGAIDSTLMEPLFEALYEHLVTFFQTRIDDYDNGRYGTQEIGFDIQRMTG